MNKQQITNVVTQVSSKSAGGRPAKEEHAK